MPVTTPTRADPLEVMKSYVTGDHTVQELFSALKGQDPETLRGIIRDHRDQLEEIDAPRAVILESII